MQERPPSRADTLATISARILRASPFAREIPTGRSSVPLARYRLGLISLGQLQSELVFQGFTGLELARLVESAILDRQRVVLDALRDAYVSNFLRGGIEVGILTARLLELGLPPDQVDLEISISLARRAAQEREIPPPPTSP